MHRSIVPLVVGVLVIVSTIGVDHNQRSLQARDLRGIANLRRMLDSTRAALAVAPTAADSTRIAAEITDREYYRGRREFHVPLRQEGLDAFWTPTGRGTISVAVGAAFVILGVVLMGPRRPRTS